MVISMMAVGEKCPVMLRKKIFFTVQKAVSYHQGQSAADEASLVVTELVHCVKNFAKMPSFGLNYAYKKYGHLLQS